MTSLLSSSQLVKERGSPRGLTVNEPVHACIIIIVHPVVDVVNTTTGARVLAVRAPRSDGLLWWCIGDFVPNTSGTSLEDVVEA
jgi:hypothetical protein